MNARNNMGEYLINVLKWLGIRIVDPEKQEEVLFSLLDREFESRYLDIMLLYFSVKKSPKEMKQMGYERANSSLNYIQKRIWRNPQWVKELSLEYPITESLNFVEVKSFGDPFEMIAQRIVLDAAMNSLKETEKEVIEDIYFNGFTLREVAEKQGCCYQAIEQKRDKALLKMRDYLVKESYM